LERWDDHLGNWKVYQSKFAQGVQGGFRKDHVIIDQRKKQMDQPETSIGPPGEGQVSPKFVRGVKFGRKDLNERPGRKIDKFIALVSLTWKGRAAGSFLDHRGDHCTLPIDVVLSRIWPCAIQNNRDGTHSLMMSWKPSANHSRMQKMRVTLAQWELRC
jgi:hypothetical protein